MLTARPLATQETQSRPSSPRDSRAPAQGGVAESGTELRSLSRHSASSVDSCEWEGEARSGIDAVSSSDWRSSGHRCIQMGSAFRSMLRVHGTAPSSRPDVGAFMT